MIEDVAARRRRLLGWGWRIAPIFPHVDLGSDLVLEPFGDGTRLAEVQAVDNVTQDLVVGLTNRLGDNLFNTQFGFDGLNAIAEETDPIMQRERIRLAVIGVLQREPRVARVGGVDVAYGDRQTRELRIDVQFTLVDGQPVTASVSPLWGSNVGS
jgi:hypothetical protein